jgi:hypothetical protein
VAGFLLLHPLSQTEPAQAQIGAAAASAVFAGLAGTAIVDRLEQKFQSVKSQADSSINLASSNGMIVAHSAIQGLRQMVADERATVFENLNSQRRQMIIDVYRTLDDVEKKIYLQRGFIVADLVNVTNNFHFLTEKVDFLVTQIDSVTQTWREGGDFEIRVTGVGVGSSSSTRKNEVSVSIDGKKLPSGQIQQEPNLLKIIIPYSDLSPRFSAESEIVRVPVVIHSDVSKKCGYFPWSADCVRPYDLGFELNLYPKRSGNVVINQTATRRTFANEQAQHTVRISSGDHHNKPAGIYYSPPIVSPPGYFILSAGYDPTTCVRADDDGDNTCDFMFDPACSPVTPTTSIQCSIAAGSHRKSFQFRYVVAQEKFVPDELPPSQPLVFEAARPQPVRFRKDAAIVTFDVSLFDGRKGRYSLKPGDANNSPLMVCGGAADIGSDVAQAECRLNILD